MQPTAQGWALWEDIKTEMGRLRREEMDSTTDYRPTIDVEEVLFRLKDAEQCLTEGQKVCREAIETIEQLRLQVVMLEERLTLKREETPCSDG